MTILAFWLVAAVLWVAALPLAARLLPRFPDAGAGLAFPLGLVVAGYLYFVLRVVDILERGRGGYAVAAALVALAGAWSLARSPRSAAALRRSWRGAAAALAIFTLFFAAFTFYRSYLPDIGGTEQPMDLMYLKATTESPSYPPYDPWLAGERASYYYFGYLQMGLLSRLADVNESTGYNLGLAWTFGAAAASIVSVAGALGRWALGSRRGPWPGVGAGLAVVLLLGGGSLAGVFEAAAAHERYDANLYETFGLESLLPCAPGVTDNCYRGPSPRTSTWYPTEFWFWFRDTRIIPGTITEFPVFSFLLGDLHPHVMAIPLVILAAGLAASAWRTRRRADWRRIAGDPLSAALVAVTLGGLGFENAWDLPTFAGLFVLAVAAREVRERGPRALPAALGYLGPVLGAAIVLYVPWWTTFSSQAAGLYAFAGEGTRPAHAFLQFGTVGAAALATLAWAVTTGRRRTIGLAIAAGGCIAGLPLAAWLVVLARQGDAGLAFESRGGEGWATLGLYAAALVALAASSALAASRRHPATPVLAVGGAGILLLLGTELFFIRDVFFGSVPRLNTVFKLSYQAWILLSIGGGVGLAGAMRYAIARFDPLAAVTAGGGLALVGGSLIFALLAVPNRTEGFTRPRAIDGFAGLAERDPAEYALARWIGEHIDPGAVVIEASGRRWGRGADGLPSLVDANVDYSDAGRVAVRTGRQTPIGWFFHEIQWRGEAIRPELERRQGLVDTVYTAADGPAAMAAIHALGATYVVVGAVERSRYPADGLDRLALVLDVVFEDGNVRVYRVPILAGGGS